MSPSPSRRNLSPGVLASSSYSSSWETVGTSSYSSQSTSTSASSSSSYSDRNDELNLYRDNKDNQDNEDNSIRRSAKATSSSSSFSDGDKNDETNDNDTDNDTDDNSVHRNAKAIDDMMTSYASNRRTPSRLLQNGDHAKKAIACKLMDGYKLMGNGEVCLRCTMPLMVESDNNDKNRCPNTGVCVVCQEDCTNFEEFERKLVDFSAMHAKLTADEDEDDEHNLNDDGVDDDDDKIYDGYDDSVYSSYSSCEGKTIVDRDIGSCRLSGLCDSDLEVEDINVLVMDDLNVLSYQAEGALINVEVTLAQIDEIDNCGRHMDYRRYSQSESDSSTLDIGSTLDPLVKEEDLEESISDERKLKGKKAQPEGSRYDNTSDKMPRRPDDEEETEALGGKPNHDFSMIPPPLFEMTMEAVQAAKKAVAWSKAYNTMEALQAIAAKDAVAWSKACLGSTESQLERKGVMTNPIYNVPLTETMLARSCYGDDYCSSEAHYHPTVIAVEEHVMAEYEGRQDLLETNLMNEVLQSHQSKLESTQISTQGQEEVEGRELVVTRTIDSVNEILQSCHNKHESSEMPRQSESVEEVRDSISENDDEMYVSSNYEQDSMAMHLTHERDSDLIGEKLTIDNLFSHQYMQESRVPPPDDAADNFAYLIKVSSKIQEASSPPIARNDIVKSLIAKFWHENSEIKRRQSRVREDFIGENIVGLKSRVVPINQSTSANRSDGAAELRLVPDRHRGDGSLSHERAFSLQVDLPAGTTTHSDCSSQDGIDPPNCSVPSSGIDPPDAIGETRMTNYGLPVIDPPGETITSSPVIDPPDEIQTTTMTSCSFPSPVNDPPEESEPITLTFSSNSSSNIETEPPTVTVHRDSIPPTDESFYSKWRKIREDAMSTVELNAKQEYGVFIGRDDTPSFINDVDIRQQLAQIEFEFSQRENYSSSTSKRQHTPVESGKWPSSSYSSSSRNLVANSEDTTYAAISAVIHPADNCGMSSSGSNLPYEGIRIADTISRDYVANSMIRYGPSEEISSSHVESLSSISENISNIISTDGTLRKMDNSVGDYQRLTEVPNNKHSVSLSPTAAARRQRYKEQLIERKPTLLVQTPSSNVSIE